MKISIPEDELLDVGLAGTRWAKAQCGTVVIYAG